MTKRQKCPRCSYSKSYVIRRQKRRCVRCKYEWQPGRFPLRLTASEWRSLLMPFFQGLSSHDIAAETGLERKRVLRALLLVRKVMTHDIPAVFSGTVEVDEYGRDGVRSFKLTNHAFTSAACPGSGTGLPRRCGG